MVPSLVSIAPCVTRVRSACSTFPTLSRYAQTHLLAFTFQMCFVLEKLLVSRVPIDEKLPIGV